MLDGVGQVENSESRSHDKDSHWSLRRVEKFKNSRRNIFRVGKYVYVLGGLKKVV